MMRPCDYENVSPIFMEGTYEILIDMVYKVEYDIISEIKKNNKKTPRMPTGFMLFSPTAKKILVNIPLFMKDPSNE